jgi:AraC-like DNA-binding protein
MKTIAVPTEIRKAARFAAALRRQIEELREANQNQPIRLAEICAAVGMPERTLRTRCIEHLGVSPMRYLWLRRMHLARATLMRADPNTTTVTEIACDYGFWELGRFSVEYRRLFGESPSQSLHQSGRAQASVKNGARSIVDRASNAEAAQPA